MPDKPRYIKAEAGPERVSPRLDFEYLTDLVLGAWGVFEDAKLKDYRDARRAVAVLVPAILEVVDPSECKAQ